MVCCIWWPGAGKLFLDISWCINYNEFVHNKGKTVAPQISIIIPMYKVEKYLRRCLDSVKNQTFTNWQAICIDDGSPDKSGAIADRYAKKDNRFIVVHKENQGVSATRNAGLKMVTGKYIMFLDSDDCIHPQTMEILHSLAEKENVDIVSFDYDRNAHSRDDALAVFPNKTPDAFQHKFNLNKIKYKRVKNLVTKSTNSDLGPKSWYVQTGMTTMRMYKRTFISGLKFDTKMRIMEDTGFWSMVLLRRPSGVITRLPLYYYTANPGSALHTGGGHFMDMATGIARVAKEYIKHGHPCDTRVWYKNFFWSLFSRFLHNAMRTPNPKDRQKIAKTFYKMQQQGLFDIIPDLHAWRYRKRIKRFILQNL